jgi:hypothetical protein
MFASPCAHSAYRTTQSDTGRQHAHCVLPWGLVQRVAARRLLRGDRQCFNLLRRMPSADVVHPCVREGVLLSWLTPLPRMCWLVMEPHSLSDSAPDLLSMHTVRSVCQGHCPGCSMHTGMLFSCMVHAGGLCTCPVLRAVVYWLQLNPYCNKSLPVIKQEPVPMPSRRLCSECMLRIHMPRSVTSAIGSYVGIVDCKAPTNADALAIRP